MDQMDDVFEMEEERIFRRLLDAISRPTIPRVPAGEKQIILRDRLAGNERLMKDYFVNYPIYNNKMFERRFRMSKHLFERLCHDLQAHDRFWILKTVSRSSLGN